MDAADVEARTILSVLAGSRAYGTATPESDTDVRGVAMAPVDVLLGTAGFKQYEGDEEDVVVYELRRYVALASTCNPNVLELLYTEDADVIKLTPLGEELRASRGLFLSRKARPRFSGYAMSQLRKIESHRRWLLHPPQAPPTRAEFGLPERTAIPKDQMAAAAAIIRKKVESWENAMPTLGLDVADPANRIAARERLVEVLTEIKASTDDERALAAGRTLGLDANFLDVLDRERRYITRRREWDSYRKWLADRNEARAELERRHGYDTKHGMHLVRLMQMCEEILTEGVVHVRRPNAAELLAVRGGAWPYDRLVRWASEQDARMVELESKSPLPAEPDRAAINDLCIRLNSRWLKEKMRWRDA